MDRPQEELQRLSTKLGALMLAVENYKIERFEKEDAIERLSGLASTSIALEAATRRERTAFKQLCTALSVAKGAI